MHIYFSESYKNNPTMKRLRVGIPLSIFLFLACLAAQAQIPTNGLLAWYKLNGNATDASANNNNGVISGNVTPVADRFGNTTGALQFGGVSNLGYITVPASSSLSFTNQQSVSMWLKFNSFIGMDSYGYPLQKIITKIGDDNNKSGFEIGFKNVTVNTASPLHYIYGFSTSIGITGNNFALAVNKWSHWVFVATGNGFNIFLNGALISPGTIPTEMSPSNSKPLIIGCGENSNFPFDGVLDDVIFYNRALTSTEISRIYNPIDTTTCRYKDSLQLVALYTVTGGPNWRNKTNWLSTRPLNEWYGIRTNTEGCVTYIDLDGNADFTGDDSTTIGNNLVGRLPSMTFSELEFLDIHSSPLLIGALPQMVLPKVKIINIWGNGVSGTIPSTWNFPKLEYLALCCNQLDGVLPTLNFPSLIGLYVQNNKLNGALPTLILPSLTQLDFGTNNFSNCFPSAYRALCPIGFRNFFGNPLLPNNGDFTAFCTNNTGLCQTTTTCHSRDSLELVKFYIATRGAEWTNKWNLNASMDTWYGVYFNNFDCVAQISLANNNLAGSLPPDMGNVLKLNLLHLSKNKIGGKIPASLGLMPDLTHLDLSFNQFNENIPTELGNLTKMVYFYLGGNKLTGEIPTSLGNMTQAIEFMLNENQLSGAIPTELGNLVNVKKLLLSENQLTGTVPTSLGNLAAVKSLQFYKNQLTGGIPTSFRNLSNLVCLVFNDNKIDFVPNLSNITSLDTGCLQSEINRLTFDDILPNLRTNPRYTYSYNPQDSIFQTITYTKNVGETLTIDLGIDAGLSSNKYVWFKNGIRFDTTNQNTFILRGVTSCDAGTYTCDVTNSNAPLLTLKSRIITLIVNPSNPQTRNKTICYGQKDTLPSGQIVSPTVSSTYRETLRNRANTCDSITITTNLTVSPLPVVTKIDSFCKGSSYKLPQTNRSVTIAGLHEDTITATNGCKTRYATTLTYRKEITQTINATFCKGESYRLPDNTSVTTAGTYTSRKTSATSCDTLITTILTLRPSVEAFDEEITVNIGDSATINLLTNDKLSSFGGRFTVIKSPTDGNWRRVTDSLIHYKAPQILRGLTQQVLDYKVCMNGCLNNCGTATLRITLKDLDTALGRIKNGVAPEVLGEGFFEIDSLVAYPQAQLFVYNNWNELVFKSTIPYDNRWSGTDQRESPLPSGVYYYVLRHAAPNRKLLDGKILLLR